MGLEGALALPEPSTLDFIPSFALMTTLQPAMLLLDLNYPFIQFLLCRA